MKNPFDKAGAYVLVDGQFGSTGKGVLAGYLAEKFAEFIDIVVSNAGPNSGHTSYYKNEKIVLKQLPTFSVIAKKCDAIKQPLTYLNGGAVLDCEILAKECTEHHVWPYVHPYAAVINEEAKQTDVENVKNMASTGQGMGPAIINKLKRQRQYVIDAERRPIFMQPMFVDSKIFIEVSQGYSLGINSGFYPHVTTRECTVSQALSDAGLPPSAFRKSFMTVRTFPIRVGSTENSSGPCYDDQEETTWEAIGQPEELTTVTKRVRRVFTWSHKQYMEALYVNDPSVIFVNFMNYLPVDTDINAWIQQNILFPYRLVLKRDPEAILTGWGPKSYDVQEWVWEGKQS